MRLIGLVLLLALLATPLAGEGRPSARSLAEGPP